MKKAKHPGRTPAERRVLDAIGGGNHSPFMRPTTEKAMLEAGLIYALPDKVSHDRLGTLRVRQFDMPAAVHMAWCDWCSATFQEEE
jgi:hypothetical protein